MPDELNLQFELDLKFKSAFEALTPGRQRGYLIYFNSAKQSKTKTDRILKWKNKILKGEGMHDGFKKKK